MKQVTAFILYDPVTGQSHDITARILPGPAYREQISIFWQQSSSDVALEIDDPEREIANLIATQELQNPARLEIHDSNGVWYQGEIDQKQCTYTEEKQETKIRVRGLTHRLKETVVAEDIWKRPGPTEYTLTEETIKGSRKATLATVEALWPGDTVTAEILNTQGDGTVVLTLTLRRVQPETRSIVWAEENPIIPEDTVLKRQNHELRFVSLAHATDLAEQDLNLTGLRAPMAINVNQIQPFEQPEYILYPLPVPQDPDLAGSVILLTLSPENPDNLIATYRNRNEGIDRQLIEFDDNLNQQGALITWANGIGGSPYPMDWTRQLAQPPSRLISHLRYIWPPFFPRPLLIDGDYTSSDPYSLTGYMVVDISTETGYELAQIATGWTLKTWTYDAVQNMWVNPVDGESIQTNRIMAGLVWDPVLNELITIDEQGPIFKIEGTTLVELTDVGQLVDQSTFTAMLENHFYVTLGTGTQLWLYNRATDQAQTITPGGVIIGKTVTFFDEALLLVTAEETGTYLKRYELDEANQWNSVYADQLVPHSELFATVIKKPDSLWIGAAGQLWAYSRSYRPLLPEANVFTNTVDWVVRNLAFLANATITDDRKGNISLIPKTKKWAPGPTLTQQESLRLGALHANHYTDIQITNPLKQAVSVDVPAMYTDGNGITRKIAGDQLAISNAFVYSNSHALSIANQLIAWHAPYRTSLRIQEESGEPFAPLFTFTWEGRVYLILAISGPLAFGTLPEGYQPSRTIEALELKPNEVT